MHSRRSISVALTGAAFALSVAIGHNALVRAATPTQISAPIAGQVYVANEGSTSVSVFDAGTNALVSTICLGSDPQDDVPGTPGAQFLGAPCDAEADHHKPFYDGHLGTHGLWLTPDGATLLVTNRISGTVVAIDTATNGVSGYAPVGREPHLATVRPGGQEAWVAVRGEHYVDVLRLDRGLLMSPDPTLAPPDRLPRSTPPVDTALGPSMVSFTANGRFAFVAAGKQAVVEKFDATTRQPVAHQALSSPFTPFGLVAPSWLHDPADEQGSQELYLVHKGIGRISILDAGTLRLIAQDLPVGPCANHVAFVGRFAYVTVGGAAPCAPGGVDREGGLVLIDRGTHRIAAASPALLPLLAAAGVDVARLAAYTPAVQAMGWSGWNGDPHGIWASSWQFDRTPNNQQLRLYVGHERPNGGGNRVTVVNTGDPNDAADDVVEATLTEPLMKQPIDVVFRPAS
jgi:YVTN family beta-propeller protein